MFFILFVETFIIVIQRVVATTLYGLCRVMEWLSLGPGRADRKGRAAFRLNARVYLVVKRNAVAAGQKNNNRVPTLYYSAKKTFCEVASLIRYRPAKREHFFLFLKNSKQSQICFFLNLWRNITESYPNRKMNKINILYAEGGRKNPLE